jgi:hypothetical protein
MTPEPKPTSVPDTLVPEHIRLSLGPLTTDKEVVLIKAGKANGFNFSEDCLRAAVNLFDNRPSFVNHGDFWSWGQRDVRDLAAHLASPRWDADQKAIIAEYRWYSQAEPLKTLAQEAADKKYFGLSADLFLTRNGQDVQSITAVESVDIVINPAAGGSFTTTDKEEIVQALTLSRFSHPFAPFAIQTPTIQKESTMPEQETLTAPAPAIAPAPSLAPPAGGIGGSDLAAVRQELAQLKIRQSGLPQTLQDKLLGRLATIPGYPAALDGDIEILRELQAELASRDTIRGLGQISNVMNSADRISLAFEKLMGLPVSQAVERLSGIREMYDILTGDWERHGIFRPERVRFAEATTTTMAHVVANVLNKVLINSFEMRPQWWKPIATEMDFPTMQDPKWITLGGFPDLDTVAEGGAYTEKAWADMNETASFVKKGNYLGITLEMIDRDDVGAVRQVPRRLGLAAARTLSSSIAALFTTNANLHDGVALFHGTHVNLLTTALSADAWDAVVQAMFKQHEQTSAKHLGIRPRYCLVPIELEKTALTIFTSELESGTMDNDINARRMSSDAVIVVPEWTDADNWYAAASPMDLETIMVGYRFGRQPELFVSDNELMGSMFTNDEMRIKVRFIYVVGIGDWRGLHRNTVT